MKDAGVQRNLQFRHPFLSPGYLFSRVSSISFAVIS